MSERNGFLDFVEEQLAEAADPKRITRNPQLPEGSRSPDFLVDCNIVSLVIEVITEDQEAFEAAGKSLLYSSYSTYYLPVIVCPDTKNEEMMLLSREMPVIQLHWHSDK